MVQIEFAVFTKGVFTIKKFISVLLAALMLITILPMSALAAEADSAQAEEMISMAVQAFPEYADRIQAKQNSISPFALQPSESAEPIYAQKTLDNGDQLIYQENLDGNAYVIHAARNDDYKPTYTVTDSATGTGYAYREITIKVTAVASSDVFYAKKVQFTHTQNGTSHIQSAGNLSSSTTTQNSAVIVRADGTNSNPAEVVYRATFRNGRNPLDPDITLRVTGTNFSITAKPH